MFVRIRCVYLHIHILVFCQNLCYIISNDGNDGGDVLMIRESFCTTEPSDCRINCYLASPTTFREAFVISQCKKVILWNLDF